ncbi:cell division protein FtsK [Plantactinospora sp. CA-294935]|uniref:cell division protein FtsK n=1 Tax=Plantactinospora sp. CA-294935 TaxID=3240012 RepID=UPI003D915F08
MAPDRDLAPVTEPDEVAHHFDIELDERPGPTPPVYVDTADDQQKQLPIIPPQFTTWAGTKRWTKAVSYRTAYRAGAHAIRSPWYLVASAWWAVVGAFLLVGRQIRWAWHPELTRQMQDAANKGDLHQGPAIERQLAARRKARGTALAAELLAVLVVGLLLWLVAPRWVLILIALVAVPVLAHYGRPSDKPIISAAVVVPRHRRLNPDIVEHAYYRAGLGKADKPDERIHFASRMAEDNTGSGVQVLVDLPHGVTFSDALKAREKLASGLDVATSQVYLTIDKSSNRRHLLWVAYVDPLSIPAGRTPLLDCKPRDIWRAVPLGVDERGRRVMLPLMFTSILVGAQPRKGKTFTARIIALFAALDPYTRLSVFDGKGSPDWRKLALVSFTYGFGLLPDRVQGDPIENLRATLRAAKQDVLKRNAKLSELPTNICPEGKLTRDIARDPRYNMPVWLIILDEFQEFLNTGDTEVDEEIAELLVFLVKVGPSVGVILLSSTQKPSGIGSSGKTAKRFTDYRDNHLTRFALKTGSWQVSDSVLGSGAYSEGYDSSALPVGDEYRGVGILYDAPVPNATVRTYFGDGGDAEKILTAARKFRERAGTLDGMAAGDQVTKQARDPLADVIDAFRSEETFLSWETLAGRLAEQMPERYAEITKDSLSKTMVGLKLGIESKTGAEKGGGDARPRGAYLANLRRALESRNSKDDR